MLALIVGEEGHYGDKYQANAFSDVCKPPRCFLTTVS